LGMSASGVIGFAADGHPIYGPFITDNGSLRRVTSSYQLKQGMRESQPGEGALPAGAYDGTYVDDYEYREESGDLDECNGMTVNGLYGYYVTASYPWVLKCFRGTPDPSFNKRSR
ncbi:MAG: YHYH protein, partial [Myxococcota bacterium]|nr:YHYH protein [Myxococcota bacterium]